MSIHIHTGRRDGVDRLQARTAEFFVGATADVESGAV